MAIDLSKLTPAPWVMGPYGWIDCTPPGSVPLLHEKVDKEFVCVARNAFEVMMRRGWSFERLESGKWVLIDTDRKGWLWIDSRNWFADTPYEAAEQMVEADRLMKRHASGDSCR